MANNVNPTAAVETVEVTDPYATNGRHQNWWDKTLEFLARPALKWPILILVMLALILAPIYFEGMGQTFMVRIMAVVGLYVILALGLNVAIGSAGLLNMGSIAFYAVGAYSGVMLGLLLNPLLTQLGVNLGMPWISGLNYFICVPFAAIAAALAGLLVGAPVLRLRGDYLAIVTLGFGEIVRIVITNNPWGTTNGAAGLPRVGQAIPRPFGIEWLQENLTFSIPSIGQYGFNFRFTDNLYWYFIIFLLVLFTIFILRRVNDSRLGRAWVAMREDEVAASSIGVNIPRVKLWAFTISAIWGGIAGVTFGNFQMFISPESFTFMESILLVCIVVLGGMGSIPGALLGAAVIQGVPELIRGMASSGALAVSPAVQAGISNYRFLVFGLLMVIMMAVRPQGLLPSKRRARELHSTSSMDQANQDLWEVQNKTETDNPLV